MLHDPSVTIVVAFAADQYERILAVMTDPALLPPSYSAWHHGFEEHLGELSRRAVQPTVVVIDPDAFVDWCNQEQLQCDVHGRLEYAAWRAARLTVTRLDPERPDVRAATSADSFRPDACARDSSVLPGLVSGEFTGIAA